MIGHLDEISALVLDPGYSITRAGFAGEDVPKSVISSYYGLIPSDHTPNHNKKLFGDNSIHNPLPRISIGNVMAKDGTVEDWDTAAKLWEYAITSRLTNAKPGPLASNGLNDADNKDIKMEGVESQEKPMQENPLLMTETGWNAGREREKGIEIAMENWGCPAFWLARSGVLASYAPSFHWKIPLLTFVRFASGKATALVIDVGASSISITPVHDGLILKKGIARSPLGGNYISQQLRLLFSTQQPPVPLTPHYLIASKTPVDAGAPSQAVLRNFSPGTEPDPSFRHFQEERILTEFKESVVATWPGPGRLGGHSPQGGTNMDMARQHPGRPFEMPDGWNQMFPAVDRYRPVESIFDVKLALSDAANPPPSPSQTIIALIQSSLSQMDVDIRATMLAHIILTGGSSLYSGFGERLQQELTAAYPGTKVRIAASSNPVERKFGSWIGGSILASLGTFHQMWISRKEYEEQGAGIVEKRCK